ncbi:uncharacterized protein LOC132842539 [Tachysurus vachellii]|uniref:uncharacterized protein LOC132842539 n=1 Tax=Tachysurus vachellii TaxID=175792 RepID=UPI00296AB70F|nr:uncharacterized protein LOC132842539 [Tachysurus vachellii]
MDLHIVKKTQSLTTAEEMRNQTKLMMQPYASWEEYLTPATFPIAILGELWFISCNSNSDFSINKNPPKVGYKYIKYPESFRACLMQVCNFSCWVFNEAHKNMDEIKLHTMEVPDYMKSALKILFEGNDVVIEAQLPKQLAKIHEVAQDCVLLGDSTETQVIDAINIIQELLEECVNAEYFYSEKLDEIKRQLTPKPPTMYVPVEFSTIHQMLVKGIDAMRRVKEQWEKIRCFFKMVSNIVKIYLNQTLKDFVSILEKTQKVSYNAKLFSKDLLYNQAFLATNITNLVNMISTTYTEVSTKHIMDRVSSLGKLMVMDKKKPEFQSEVQHLRNSSDEAQKAIFYFVLKNKKEFEEKSLARLEKIDKELLAILPAAAPEELKSIQAAVKSGFTEEDESAYA